jgi:alkylhydroperoxidase family enzyme/glyoxylase-like metal-dependent hydrolase (beta-lactamase superfamily II)
MPGGTQLRQVSAHVWMWVDAQYRPRDANQCLVRHGDEALLVNVGADGRTTRRLTSTVETTFPDMSIDGVVVSDAAICRTGGHRPLPDTKFITSEAVADELTRRPDPPADLPDVSALRPASSFGSRATLRLGSITVDMIELGPAYADGNTVVWLPGERTLITGDVVCSGYHPAAFACSIHAWHAACSQLIDLRPDMIVPGHGPPVAVADLIDLRDYLDHIITEVSDRCVRGIPAEEAAIDLPLRHWILWAHPENVAVTIAAIYRQLGAAAPTEDQAHAVATEVAAGLRRTPRIPPLRPPERHGRTADVLGVTDGDAQNVDKVNLPNIHTTLARHADLYEQTVPIAQGVINGFLPPRCREIAILRGAWACAAVYQWTHHRHVARSVGLTPEDIDAISHDINNGAWTSGEAAVIQAVDELHTDAAITDDTWAHLVAHFTTEQIIELITLIGEYHKVSFQLNAWRVPVEAWAGPIQLPTGWLTR